MLSYNYYGHACFRLDDGINKILVDPFLANNPKATINEEKVQATYILLSHAHGDHLGDTYAIAKRTGALVIAIPEIIEKFDENLNTLSMNLGGTLKTNFGFIRMVLALHSSGVSGGVACGYVINIDGKTIYYSGDSALFSDMELIGERDKINYAILPIGGHFTMDCFDAARAVDFLKPDNVIPVHYDTWNIIAQNPAELKKFILNSKIHIVKPGQSIELN